MGDATTTGDGLDVESIGEFVVGGPQSFTPLEVNRGNGDVHRVDEVCVQELTDRRDAAPEAHVLTVCCLLRLSERIGGSRIDEVKGGVRQRERRSHVVGEDEHRRVKRWYVA